MNSTPNSLWQVPRVLLIVHDHAIRDSVVAALADEDYEVVTTVHGAAALTRSVQWHPNLMLLDLRVPATDRGASMARYRRAAGPDVAIIGLAGFPVADVGVLAAQAGADAGLAMPFDPDELRTLVRWHLSHHTSHRASDAQPVVAAYGEARAGDGRGRVAIVNALRRHAAQSERHTPWMTATDLAQGVGAGVHDREFAADVQALYEAGIVRLMSGGNAGGGTFYEAMLVPLASSFE
jgi:DNA-binding response OmpR family regulator